MNWLLSGEKANLDDIAAFLGGRSIRLHAPMVLISQVQRSGGSLLNQLFDGHPALDAYPQELRLGYAHQDQWPELDVDLDSGAIFRSLYDLKFGRLMRRGYVKGGVAIVSRDQGKLLDRNPERYRFFLVPRVQYLLFKRLFKDNPPKSQRDVLNYFFSAFFNAWLDYQGRLENKKWITAFAPRLAHGDAGAAAFFTRYPDGRLIQIVRDPRTWYPSAKNHRKSVLEGKETTDLLTMWIESTKSILRNKARYGDRVIILTFEDMVGRADSTMQRLARELDIEFDPILLEPTFNGSAIKANSSFAIEQTGIIAAPLSRASKLSAEERELIESQCVPLYDSLADQALTARADAEGPVKTLHLSKKA